jgi:hypothetical protein
MRDARPPIEPGGAKTVTKEYKYIVFKSDNEIFQERKKRPDYECRNKKDGTLLGLLCWCAAWRQYCYYPETNTMYSQGCLEDIADFIKNL